MLTLHELRLVCRLVLEMCEGTLRDLLDTVAEKTDKRGLPVLDVIVLGITLVDAVRAVHDFAGALHLDIKPDNVLLRNTKNGKQVAVLADYGLMHKLPGRIKQSYYSQTKKSLVSGVARGTAGYAPPEQQKKRAGRRSDVYSLGATLLFAATFEEPYGGASEVELADLIWGKGEHALMLDACCVLTCTEWCRM